MANCRVDVQPIGMTTLCNLPLDTGHLVVHTNYRLYTYRPLIIIAYIFFPFVLLFLKKNDGFFFIHFISIVYITYTVKMSDNINSMNCFRSRRRRLRNRRRRRLRDRRRRSFYVIFFDFSFEENHEENIPPKVCSLTVSVCKNNRHKQWMSCNNNRTPYSTDSLFINVSCDWRRLNIVTGSVYFRTLFSSK